MSFRCFFTQHIQNRFFYASHFCFSRSLQVEHNNFILSFFQPATRHIQSLLRTDFPETSHSMSVYPNHTFSPSLHIQESITCLIQTEGSFIICRSVNRLACLIVLLADKFIERRQVVYFPAFQFLHLFAAYHFHLVRNTFPVMN